MSWEWSHTAEAYEAAKENVKSQPREWLAVVFAEWRASQNRKGQVTQEFKEKKYARAMKFANDPEKITTEALATMICENMEQLRTCTNGGYEAYACPFGCMGHLVSFNEE